MKSIINFLVSLILIQFSEAQILGIGACNKTITTVENFLPSRYVGRWYENQKYPFIFELGGKCIYAEYSLLSNGDIGVYNFNINQLTGKPSGINGTAQIVADGKLKVKFNNMPAFLGGGNYWILETDYDNYAVVYSCRNIGGLVNAKVVWILTRERQPNPDYVERAKSVIRQKGLSLKSLHVTDQTGCDQSSGNK